MDALANKTNGFHVRPAPEQPQTHLSNGLEQNMSKFFSDFHKYNSKQVRLSLLNYSLVFATMQRELLENVNLAF